MEEGKLYKGICSGMIVKCLSVDEGSGIFKGVIIEKGESTYSVGDISNTLVCRAFSEYTPLQTLINGSSYIIPKGCKAEIKDGVVTIKDTIEHFKIQPLIPSIYTIYVRKYPDRQINVYIFDSGHASISHNKIDAGDKCTEQEFMEAYNKAIKELSY